MYYLLHMCDVLILQAYPQTDCSDSAVLLRSLAFKQIEASQLASEEESIPFEALYRFENYDALE